MGDDFDVVEFKPGDPPTVGDQAPEFVRPLVGREFWVDASLHSLLETAPVLLLFHSMIGSFPPIYLWDEIDDRLWDERYGLTPIGVTVSTPYDIRQFIVERDLDIRIFSDPCNTVAQEYDVAHDLDGMSGVSEPKLAMFVIDSDFTIVESWIASQWPEFPPYEEIEGEIANRIGN